jgi:hypothetical protein
MKMKDMHWAVSALILIVSIALGVILADKYLEKCHEKKMKKDGVA